MNNQFFGIQNAWVFIISIAVGLFFASMLYFFDKKNRYNYGLTSILFILKASAVSLIMLLLFNPYLRKQNDIVEEPTLVLAYDNSASLTEHRDAYSRQTKYLRSELQSEFQLDEYLFGTHTRPFDSLQLSDDYSNIADALTSINRLYHQKNVGAVVLFSDGIYNQGFAPETELSDFPFRIYTVLCGDTTQHTDLAIRQVHYNKTTNINSQFTLRIELTAKNANNTTANLIVKQNENIVSKNSFTINSNTFSKTFDIELFSGNKEGVMQLDIVVESPLNEELTSNNHKRIFVEVVNKKYKVLICAPAPHPDLGAVASALDDRYEVDFWYLDNNTPDFNVYDLLILHQLPGRNRNDESIKQLLDKNNHIPIWFMIGSETNLNKLNEWQSSYKMQLGSSSGNLDVKALYNSGFTLFTLDKKLQNTIDEFPPLNTPHLDINAVNEHDFMLEQKLMNVATQLPLLSFARDTNDRKNAFLFGTNIWRWRLFDYFSNNNHNIYNELINKTIQYLLIQSDDKLTVDFKTEYTAAESIQMKARLSNALNELVANTELRLTLTNRLNNKQYEYLFSRNNNDYELNIGMLPEGIYSFKAYTEQYYSTGQFSVVASSIEQLNLRAEMQRMQLIAQATGGKAFSLNQMDNLKVALTTDNEITSTTHSQITFTELISYKIILLIIATLLFTEWLLRKIFRTY